jgi:predicted transporter
MLGWIGLVILAIMNGALRDKTYGQFLGELTAHQLSTFTGIIIFGIYIWIFMGFVPIESSKQAILIGSVWLIMTVIFEFVFGHFVMNQPWHKLFHDYNILEGRVWSLVLIWTFISIYFFYRFRY